ncbi:MAG TPA: nuclear transport factor 2 family protein [Streptosporangiaceae bacterium]|nr:nuclear transport factor 2 family protein [Streptosporangiaceae bacterium]
MASASGEGTPNLSDIERRLQSLEDQLAIHRIIMTHPPAADSGEGGFWHVIFGEGGRTDYGQDASLGDLAGIVTPEQLAAWTASPRFREAQRSGLAHVSTAPVVVIAGDEAEAWNYHQTIVRTDDGFRVLRLFVNHWQFARSAQGWQLTMRKCRLMDGDEEALDILRDAVAASSALLGSADGPR